MIEYTEAALRDAADTVVTLAAAEDLPAHGQAVTARFVSSAPANITAPIPAASPVEEHSA